MEKRYQVFVSSTYTDLKEERKHVLQTLMEMDCIPSGMELFPAMDEEQLTFIKSIIDDCDYYLLIIGGRYGSMADDGLSYTEKEFDYAVSKGIKVLAFLHEDPENISVNKSDIDSQRRKKLIIFRKKVEGTRLVKYWKTTAELPGLVSLSLQKTIKTYPAIGWIRANKVANSEILEEINNLRKENEKLKEEYKKNNLKISSVIDNIADFDALFIIHFTETTLTENYDEFGSPFSMTNTRKSEYKLSWRKIFSRIAPTLLSNPIDEYVMKRFTNTIEEDYNSKGFYINLHDFETIAIQLDAYELISRTPYSRESTQWSLTQKGKAVMMQNRIVTKDIE